MALVPIRIDRTSKPPLCTPIDWSNPLAQGLVGAWAFNEGGGNIAYNIATPNVITGGSFVNDGIKFSGTNSRIETGKIYNFSAGMTQLVTFKKPAPNTVNCSFLNDKNSTNWAQTNGFAFIVRTNGGLFIKIGSSETYNSIDNQVCDGIKHVLVGVWKPGVRQTAYKDGIEVSFNSSAVANSYTASAYSAKIGQYYTETTTYTSDNYQDIQLVWNRALSSVEIASLSENPWQIYEPEIKWVWVDDGAGATTSSADPDSLTVTGIAATDYRGLISGATAGVLTATGVAATSTKGFLSVAEYATVSISSANATDYRGLISFTEPGAVTTTGTDSTGTRTLISATETGTATTSGANTADYAGHISATQASSITASGIDSTGVYTPVGSTTSTAQPWILTVLGVNASGIRTLISLTEPGAVNLTGVNASGFRGLLSVTETGALAVTGVNSTDTTGELTSIAPYTLLSVNGYNTTDYRPGREIPIFSGRTIPVTSGRQLSLTSGRTIPVIQ